MEGIYYQVIDVTDFGPYVTKLVLGMPRDVETKELEKDAFSVFVTIRDKKGDVVEMPKSFIERDQFVPSLGYRVIKDVYASDMKGGKVSGKSRYAALELEIGPAYKCSSAIAADFKNINGHERYTINDYRVDQIKEIGDGDDKISGLTFSRCAGVFNPDKERFQEFDSEDETKVLRYGYFTPNLKGGKKPLIVWLHGAGEGGDETSISYSGNNVPALTEDWVQKKFGGVFVLSPQCPTMWLDDGSGQYGDSGNSKYVEVLKATIDHFIDRFADAIDTDRIYVGGDSNGGFMTMRMIMDYPDFFAAAFPICEAMIDNQITDAHIDRMKDMPIWFTHAKNDPVVVPEKYVSPTYDRLMKAGAKNVHFTFWDKIVDMHMGFKDENGNPFEYLGHFAWIPMLNDDCKVDFDGKPVVVDGKEVTLLDWLALQKK
ncbi:prolyl oligopeptidase family serine peptidase [Butyrivibrio sp. WCD3002]|uniref:prolyl oligopeptidase family serine peptidase n=1 Tax=Butyrivibrio sp. WCD3002 TaxID=1280676 RepID=UPI000413ADCB|nr:prolyl oligopeptidase family serine peptidase [Butyrivibrio sp. WCD3002]